MLNPKIITVEPDRLHSGLWGYPEGDISASYSADTYAENKTLRSPFKHAHQFHVAMNVSGRINNLEAKAYPIVHSSYYNDIMDDLNKSSHKDYYTGSPIQFKRSRCILGLPVIFRQQSFSLEEIVDLIRRMYAYGGYFAVKAGSYQNLLRGWLENTNDSLVQQAFELELSRNDLPQERNDMRNLIEALPRSHNQPSNHQLTLF